MPARSPEDRTLIAKIASAERWGRTVDRTAATAPARAGLRAKYAREIDPAGTLPADELEKRVESLVRAHMLRMSRAAQAARRAKRGDALAATSTAATGGKR